MTAQEGDRIAEMVLHLVTHLVRAVLPPLEPTGTGYLADDIERFVNCRSDMKEVA